VIEGASAVDTVIANIPSQSVRLRPGDYRPNSLKAGCLTRNSPHPDLIEITGLAPHPSYLLPRVKKAAS